MGKEKNNEKLNNQELDYREMKQAQKKQRQLDNEERERCYREARRNKHYKKLEKKARLRPLKNFLWWFCGFCSFIVIVGGSVFGTLYFVKVKDIAGENSKDYVSDEIANKTLLDAGLGYASYTVGDIPAIKLLVDSLSDSIGLSDYITIDYDALNNSKIISSDIVNSLTSCIKVTATLGSTGAIDSLGSLGDLNIMHDYELVETEKLPDESVTDFNKDLYYYQLDDGSFAVAFDENHKRLPQAEGKDLYYPALKDVPILSLGKVMDDRLNTVKVKSLLTAFGVDEGNSIFNVLGEKDLEEMKTFDTNDIKLSDVLDVETNKSLYEMLLSINDMSYSGDEEFNALARELTIGELSGLDVKNLQLTVVLSNEIIDGGETRENEKLYSILRDMCRANIIENYKNKHNSDPENADDLWETIDAEHNFDLIVDEGDKNKFITVGCLDNANTNNIRLVNVIDDNPTNQQLFSIILDMTSEEGVAKEKSDILVGDLNSAEVNKIKLVNVLDSSSNKSFYDILRDMTGKTVDKDFILSANNISASDYDNATETQKAEYLRVAEESKNREITLASLNGKQITDIKLKTIMGDSSENAILDKLLKKEEATVGNVGVELNKLTMSEIYDIEVFTVSTDKVADYLDSKQAYYRFDEENKRYLLTNEGDFAEGEDKYYISKESSIWLFMLYDEQEVDGSKIDDDGFGKCYEDNGMTIKQITESISAMTSEISDATIRQLVGCGILTPNSNYGNNELLGIYVYTKMLKDSIGIAS